MKKPFLLIFGMLLSLLVFNNSYAELGKILQASFAWEKTVHDFGKIAQNKPVKIEFEFTNTGDSPLVISDAKASCGCTVASYPKDPILPGKIGKITGTYNAASLGIFNKNITITANTSEPVVLAIKGEVVANGR